MPPAIDIVLDCSDPDLLADFWAAALGYRRHGTAGAYRSIVPDAADGRPKIILQKVPEPKAAKNRMHIDIVAANIEAEAVRLEGLGAEREPGGSVEEHQTRWIRMRDPEGNEFCVCQE